MITPPLTGEPLALDLVNTRWPADGRTLDVLDGPAAATEWLTRHGIEPVDGALEPLLATRAAIRAHLDDGSPGALDHVLAHGRLRLGVDAAGPREGVEVDDPAWGPAWRVARSFHALLREAPADRLRHCAGPGCVLWFLDTSRNGRRRWCSMTGCGNRAKARAHYRRTR